MSQPLLAVLWRRRWTVVAIVLLAAAAAALASQWLPKRYTTESRVVIQPREAASFDAVQAAQATARTYSQALSGLSYAREVSERLGGTAEAVAAAVDLAQVPETQLVEIRAEASSPDRAKALADTYATVFTESATRMLAPSADMEVSVVDQAPLNESPARPRTTLNVLIAVLLAVPLAVGAAVLRDRRDPRMATDELESELALPVLVRVPERGRSGRNLPAFKEAFRVLRAKMPFTAEDGGMRTVSVTSPSAGDGRTTVTWELALAAVEAGRHAIVVELDPDDGTGDEPRGPGFWDCVAGTVELDDVVATSPVDNLYFIAAGGSPSAEVLQRLDGDRGRVVAESLARTADIVIFDAPPALERPEAIAAARFADATLLVVDLAKSSRREINDAVRGLRTGGAYLVGSVVNRAATGSPGAYRRARGSEQAPAR